MRSLKYGGDPFTDRDGINHIWKGSNKTRFQYCQSSCNTLLKIRAIQGHAGGDLIEPELMGHVALSLSWKQFLLHRGCWQGSLQVKRKAERGERLYSSLHWTPGEVRLKKNSKVTCRNREEDAVYWIHLAKTQEKGFTFWQTESHAIVAYETVPLDCIERVPCQKGETTFFQRLSTPRPAPRITLKKSWNGQQQQQQQGDLGGFRSENNVVCVEDSFQVNLRVHGVSQHVIYKDEERMTKIQT